MVEVIDKADGERVQNLIYILGIDNDKVEEIISYSLAADDPVTCASYDKEKMTSYIMMGGKGSETLQKGI